jgi:single-strand DNA-binding protein
MNQLTLVGHLTRDPRLRTLSDGRSVCDMRVAVNGARGSQPLFIDVATFGAHAEACAQYLAKGREVGFTGRLVYSEWRSPDGAMRSKHSAIGQVDFRGRPPEPAEPEPEPGALAMAAPARARRRPEKAA